MEILFDGIPLDKVSTSMTINSTAAILLCMYIAVAEKQGVSADKISGTIQNDILKEYMARGTYIYPPKESMRIITDIFAYCKDNVPKWNTISISGYHIREAGSSAVQEVAFTLADGIAYVDAAIKAGLEVDEFAPRLAFFFNAHNNLFEEVAKFRAARRIWAKIMTERFGAKDPKSQMLRFHTQTAGCTLTAQQPDNNIMRVTIQALSAVLGGTQSLHTNSRDEALALPTEDSVRIALRTQQVIAYESGAADSIDPLAGSFLVESLTDQIEKAALEYIEKIDKLGGAVEAISRGFQQKEIQDSAYAYQKSIEKDQLIIVGVNKFTVKEAAPTGLLRVKEEVEISQKASLAGMKAGRDDAAVKAALAQLAIVAKSTDNLMPHILAAVKTYATLGEIADVFRGVFGKHTETVVL
jgi:methylmalonyl-CoA mutase N-terminal domain/subunit